MTSLTPLRRSTGVSSESSSTKHSAQSLPAPWSKDQATISLIQNELLTSSTPWFLGFSGGKDSSALLKLTYLALAGLPADRRKPVCVLYCDTGVENPLIVGLVRSTFRRLAREAAEEHIPIRVRVARPRESDRYFVKVIGRGYPPPTNKFRWCTDRLRIDPIRRVLSNAGCGKSVVMLGIRLQESPERDRTIARYRRAGTHHLRQTGNRDVTIFSPLLTYSAGDVWATLAYHRKPGCIDVVKLTKLYRAAGGECPIVRDPRGTPCAQGRFGCWTCTVVRRDRAAEGMIRDGYERLKPLLDWRDWILRIRDMPASRCSRRRNGTPGPGPFTLATRRLMLRKLLSAQSETGWRLISPTEMRAIHNLWRQDAQSPDYRE